jgi:hypothetical protein
VSVTLLVGSLLSIAEGLRKREGFWGSAGFLNGTPWTSGQPMRGFRYLDS